MIYSCLEVKTTGPNGTTLRPKTKDDSELLYIGELSDRQYYIGLAGADQHAEIDLRQETISPEIDQIIKQSQVTKANKQVARKDIETEVGDLHDLLADQAKTIEFLFAIVARMGDEYLGGNPIPTDLKSEYLARVQSVTTALDNNAVTLRGDFTDPSEMLNEIMGRTDKINQIVRDKHITRIKELVEAK